MKALVWVTASTWQACVERARALVPDTAEVCLLHVIDDETMRLAIAPGPGRLGRHRAPPQADAVVASAETEARALLADASERFGRPARTEIRRGRVEHEVAAASEDADLLVVARDGEGRHGGGRGPHSLGKRVRFVVDHASCDVALVWANAREQRAERPLPPPPPPGRHETPRPRHRG